MMKIIIAGDRRPDKEVRILECKGCGCVFKTDEYEYKINGFKFYDKFNGERKASVFIAKCPCCGEQGKKYMGFIADDFFQTKTINF